MRNKIQKERINHNMYKKYLLMIIKILIIMDYIKLIVILLWINKCKIHLKNKIKQIKNIIIIILMIEIIWKKYHLNKQKEINKISLLQINSFYSIRI